MTNAFLHAINPMVMDYFSPWMTFVPHGQIKLMDTAGVIEPCMATQHFLFYTATDMLCFCHFYPHFLKNKGSNVFTALGPLPTAEQLLQLTHRFPNARICGVFDNSVCGKVLDCKIMLWQMSKDIAFSLIKQDVCFRYKEINFRIPVAQFSLHRFKVFTGIRSTYRTIKPKLMISYSAMIALNPDEQ